MKSGSGVFYTMERVFVERKLWNINIYLNGINSIKIFNNAIEYILKIKVILNTFLGGGGRKINVKIDFLFKDCIVWAFWSEIFF